MENVIVRLDKKLVSSILIKIRTSVATWKVWRLRSLGCLLTLDAKCGGNY